MEEKAHVVLGAPGSSGGRPATVSAVLRGHDQVLTPVPRMGPSWEIDLCRCDQGQMRS